MGRKKAENTTNDNFNNLIEVDQEYDKIVIEKVSATKTQLQKIDEVSKNEIKNLVKLYYETQRIRIMANNYVDKNDSTIIERAFTPDVIDYKIIEKNIENQLLAICKSQEVGRWLLSITGIGPVLAAGLFANFDITKATYASNFTSYAGLNDYNRPWLGKEKSKKILDDILQGRKEVTDEDVYEYSARTQWKYEVFLEGAYNQKTNKWSATNLVKLASRPPYNADLKTLLWKVGESIKYQKNRPQSLYGKIYNERVIYELIKNEKGAYKEQAEQILATKNIGKETNAYQAYIQGKLPLAHIYTRSSRFVQKIIVNHLFNEMWRVQYDTIPPKPYIIDHSEGKHNDIILPEVPYTKVTGEVVEKSFDTVPEYFDTLNWFIPEYEEILSAEEFESLDQLKLRILSDVKNNKM